MRVLASVLIGLVFGCGIVLSGMGNPAKVVNFFDVAGSWDPSLILVMGGALAVTFLGYRVVLRRPAPVLDTAFHLPKSRAIDARLLGGSALFGVGWGISGFCPGGALPMLGTGNADVLVFLAAMTAGIVIARTAIRWRDRSGAAPAPFRQ